MVTFGIGGVMLKVVSSTVTANRAELCDPA
jgi:hypothetical protein